MVQWDTTLPSSGWRHFAHLQRTQLKLDGNLKINDELPSSFHRESMKLILILEST
jgi:hypothetical protein